LKKAEDRIESSILSEVRWFRFAIALGICQFGLSMTGAVGDAMFVLIPLGWIIILFGAGMAASAFSRRAGLRVAHLAAFVGLAAAVWSFLGSPYVATLSVGLRTVMWLPLLTASVALWTPWKNTQGRRLAYRVLLAGWWLGLLQLFAWPSTFTAETWGNSLVFLMGGGGVATLLYRAWEIRQHPASDLQTS